MSDFEAAAWDRRCESGAPNPAAGKYTDIKFSNKVLVHFPEPHECAKADETSATTEARGQRSTMLHEWEKRRVMQMQARVRARHKKMPNDQPKIWGILA